MKKLHLVCNAHLDPVWQWEWEEGLAEALSTFRVAARFCDEFDGFVFNHNEALLYEWTERYDPALFERIRRLVGEGKWHIMGGWYLQPDVNMPCGEAILRQIRAGREYFADRFGVVPTTAVNFDSFGHSRGLVQLLAKTGYDSYLFCRPHPSVCAYPGADFLWRGYDGSAVLAHISEEFYSSTRGRVRHKIDSFLEGRGSSEAGVGVTEAEGGAARGDGDLLMLWGIGDHGGGPSEADLRAIASAREDCRRRGFALTHSTPEAYFAAVSRDGAPEYEAPLRWFAPGCYTTMSRVKQAYAALEAALFAGEKLYAAAHGQTGLRLPRDRFEEAEKILLFHQFHDILPGTCTPPGEAAALRALHRGMDVLSEIRLRAFFAMTAGQPATDPASVTVLVYNPHPYEVTADVRCEFQMNGHERGTFTAFYALNDGVRVPAQLEKEDANLPFEWRKNIVLHAALPPMKLSRFDCYPEGLEAKPALPAVPPGGFRHTNRHLTFAMEEATGLFSLAAADGSAGLAAAGGLLVMRDTPDPWGINQAAFGDEEGRFRLASPVRAGELAGVDSALAPVHILEDGEVRTVVEAMYVYNDSHAIVRYMLPKQGDAVTVSIKICWQERDRCLKWSLPGSADRAVAGAMLGQEALKGDGSEEVYQRWVAACAQNRLTGIVGSGSYGCDFRPGELRMTLLRSPAYCAHPMGDRQLLPQDRYTPRIDMGWHEFRFQILPRPIECLSEMERQAQAFGEPPYALSMFLPGEGTAHPGSFLQIGGDVLVLTAMEAAVDGYVIRLYNPSPLEQRAGLTCDCLHVETVVELRPFEIKAYCLYDNGCEEISLLDRRRQ